MPVNGKAIKNRIRSVDSTLHMAKAMELVASSKMRRAGEMMEKSRNYAQAFRDAFRGMGKDAGKQSPYFREGKSEKTCYVLIAGDRGLAGGYNNAVFKLLREAEPPFCVVPIGKRAVEFVGRGAYETPEGAFDSTEKMTASDCASLSRSLCRRFREGEYRRVCVIMTECRSMLSQTATVKTLLPIETEEGDSVGGAGEIEFEPDRETVLEQVAPAYVAGLLWGDVRESYESELYARRNAMSNAADNATEMIETLSMQYNRARQGAITQEITEIVAGADA